MKKLLLFDIDGTLLKGHTRYRFINTITNLHGITPTSDGDFRGYTDYLTLSALLESEGWDVKQIKKAMPELLIELDRLHKETVHTEDMRILPGVKQLLETIDKNKNTLGLITGNIKSIAKRKLEFLDIWQYFSVGGFGSDPHETRADLVRIAIKRAGYENNMELVYVIGDTPLDIQATKKAGVTNSVGVANGFRDTKELVEAGAKIVLEDFKNPDEVIEKLRLN
jgi:phosphoglycolate phosphatase-like HAD superfamily hydrolase